MTPLDVIGKGLKCDKWSGIFQDVAVGWKFEFCSTVGLLMGVTAFKLVISVSLLGLWLKETDLK
jgi:hypothetical protein